MALRSSWEGFLKLSLLSIPVRAYNAIVPGDGEFHFHQIHKNCCKRIRYQKVCPVHGPVTKEEIDSGYEYEKDQYVQLEPEEIVNLRSEADQAITIDTFLPPHDIDPRFLTGKTYYLVPEGPAGLKPYVLLHHVMRSKERNAVASVVMAGHDEAVLIRPLEKLLVMSVLYRESQIKSPSAFADEIREVETTAQERKLATTLVDASTSDHLELARFKDLFTERVADLIEDRLVGKKEKPGHLEKHPPVINLMDALRQSVEQTGRGTKTKSPTHSRAHRAHHHAKRKTA